MVDFENLMAHDFKVKTAMLVQGWSKFFERLIGPVYPTLVKEFWTHATATSTAIVSFVLGHEVVVAKKMIRKLYGLDGLNGVTRALAGRTDWERVDLELFSSGTASPYTTDLKPPYRVWAKIILGSLYHRRPSSSATYVNQDQKYVLFCIRKGMRVNLPHILFQHLKTIVEESRDEERKKHPKLKKNSIPFGRMISDILTESGLLDTLRAEGSSHNLSATHGSILNAQSLRRMQLIEKVITPPIVFPHILTRRTRVVSFSHMFKEELEKSVKSLVKSCKKEKKLKIKVTEEGPDVKKAKKLNKSLGTANSDSVPNNNNSGQIPTKSLKIPRTSEQLQKLIDDIYHEDSSSFQTTSNPSPQKRPPPADNPSSSTTTKNHYHIISEPSLDPQPLNTVFLKSRLGIYSQPHPLLLQSHL
ncbi:uncharacterized protein LOC131633470 [Vicia villosa]|uniref:uncharacterized protein LOC131633470 n=1 Tax=Vicia villosa TaxID=3911 RepID=UPI00273B3299|nr:uncharacterized protein LOC131633470 [Vicia villosa]